MATFFLEIFAGPFFVVFFIRFVHCGRSINVVDRKWGPAHRKQLHFTCQGGNICQLAADNNSHRLFQMSVLTSRKNFVKQFAARNFWILNFGFIQKNSISSERSGGPAALFWGKSELFLTQKKNSFWKKKNRKQKFETANEPLSHWRFTTKKKGKLLETGNGGTTRKLRKRADSGPSELCKQVTSLVLSPLKIIAKMNGIPEMFSFVI